MAENPKRKSHIVRPLLRWEDVVKREVEFLSYSSDWKVRATDMGNLRIGCNGGEIVLEATTIQEERRL